MKLEINSYGSDVALVTTDAYYNQSHLSSAAFSNLVNIINSGSEGQMLIFKDGCPRWVNMPTNFQTYFNQIK